MSKREEKRLWESLLKHPGWIMLNELLDQRVSNIASDVCRPMLEMSEALDRNTRSGEMMGIQFVQALPQQQADMLADDLKKAEGNSEDDDEPAA